ncbi:MAG TPA: GTP cyclohydrolase, FolE2/MptA family [Candidatus Saccharimonadales bacterium]|nr:GTP cyclohydrolase, FolE2/MptA family [Candidatus Saccharimonadales bacterium]
MPKIPFDIINDKSFADIPASEPDVKAYLPKVGISNRPHYISVVDPFTKEPTRLLADIITSFDLPAKQRGLHMSRIEGSLHKIAASSPVEVSGYTAKLFELNKESQKQNNCRIELSADYEIEVDKNESKRPSYELLKLYSAIEDKDGKRSVETGITVPFINACPCTQRWGMKAFYEELKADGYKDEEIFALIEKAPLQAHTNRGEATITVHSDKVDYKTLYKVVEDSTVIIRELLSGQDEHFAVRDTHKNGQFCEDVIREVMANLVKRLDTKLPDETKVRIHVEVDESVHFHNLFAEIIDSFANIKASIEN